MPRYRDTLKDRQLEPAINWRYYREKKNPKIDLQKDFKSHKRFLRREKINNSARSISKRIERNSSRRMPSLGGLVGGFVSTILLLGIVATLFAAYNNSLSPDRDSFEYFSIQRYADGFTFEYDVEPGIYSCRIRKNLGTTVYAEVNIDGRWFRSLNSVSAFLLPNDKIFRFEFNDVVYNTICVATNDPKVFDYILRLPAMVLRVTQPELDVVGDAWSNVVGLDRSLVHAFSVTGRFIVDSLRYQSDVVRAVLPWNGMSQGSRSYIDSLWSDAEETVEEWREEMNNGED